MVRVAFATSDGLAVDAHFGRCDRFDVYEVSPHGAIFLESREPAAVDDSHGRIDGRVSLLRDCAILHVASIGGAAAARVVNARIHPLKVVDGAAIADLAARLVTVLSGNPPPWLRKALRERNDPGTPVRSLR